MLINKLARIVFEIKYKTVTKEFLFPSSVFSLNKLTLYKENKKWTYGVYLHEEIERQSDGLELVNKVSDRTERAKIERHDDDLEIGKLDHGTGLGVLDSLGAFKPEGPASPLAWPRPEPSLTLKI